MVISRNVGGPNPNLGGALTKSRNRKAQNGGFLVIEYQRFKVWLFRLIIPDASVCNPRCKRLQPRMQTLASRKSNVHKYRNRPLPDPKSMSSRTHKNDFWSHNLYSKHPKITFSRGSEVRRITIYWRNSCTKGAKCAIILSGWRVESIIWEMLLCKQMDDNADIMSICVHISIASPRRKTDITFISEGMAEF